MRRRDFLAGVSLGALAGCLDSVGALTRHRPSPERCPSFEDDPDRIVCAGRESPDVPVAFSRSKPRLSPDADPTTETLTFTLRNDSDRTFDFNPNDWELRAWTTDGWRHVAPDVIFQPLFELPPGGAFRWKLGRQSRSDSDSDSNARRTYRIAEPLDPGAYAFSVPGDLGGTRIECVARFRVAGE